MKIIPVIVSIILASATLGYGPALAYTPVGFQAGQGENAPCTTSYPCAKICNDHLCAPGEVYAPAGSTNSTGTNSTQGKGTLSKQPSSANSIVAKATNSTVKSTKATNSTVKSTKTLSFSQVSNSTEIQSTSISSTTKSPQKQVSSGIAPAKVKCSSGYKLALNKFNSRPACVTDKLMKKLVARGWAKS